MGVAGTSRMITRLSSLSVIESSFQVTGHSTLGTSTCRMGHTASDILSPARAPARRGAAGGSRQGQLEELYSLALSDGFISSYSDDVTSPAASERARGHRRFAHILCDSVTRHRYPARVCACACACVPHPTNTSTNGGQDRRGNATCVSHGRNLCARSSSRVLSLHAWHSGSLRRYTPRLCEMLGTVRRQRQHEQKQHRCFISSDCDHRGRQHVACVRGDLALRRRRDGRPIFGPRDCLARRRSEKSW